MEKLTVTNDNINEIAKKLEELLIGKNVLVVKDSPLIQSNGRTLTGRSVQQVSGRSPMGGDLLHSVIIKCNRNKYFQIYFADVEIDIDNILFTAEGYFKDETPAKVIIH